MNNIYNGNDTSINQLQKLQNFEILDTQPEIEFDLITALVAEIFNAPVSLISFFDDKRAYIKSAFGYESNISINLSNSLFERANIPLSIENLQENELTNNEKFYLADRQILSYVSAPLITDDGFTIGNICAINFETMQITEFQLSMFEKVVKLVLEKLNGRLFFRNWIKLSDERVHMLIHDLKNPMTTLCLHSELIGKMAHDREKVMLMADKMNKQSKTVVDSMNNILSSSRTENGIVKMKKEKLDVKELLQKVKLSFEEILQHNFQTLLINLNHEAFVYGDENRLINAISQVVANAIKFSKSHQKIEIAVKEQENSLVISVKDEGKGILSDEIDLLFTKFAKLSAISSNYQQSNGLGLAIAKMLIDLHKGKIWAESNGKDLGSTFYIELPTK